MSHRPALIDAFYPIFVYGFMKHFCIISFLSVWAIN